MGVLSSLCTTSGARIHTVFSKPAIGIMEAQLDRPVTTMERSNGDCNWTTWYSGNEHGRRRSCIGRRSIGVWERSSTWDHSYLRQPIHPPQCDAAQERSNCEFPLQLVNWRRSTTCIKCAGVERHMGLRTSTFTGEIALVYHFLHTVPSDDLLLVISLCRVWAEDIHQRIQEVCSNQQIF